MSMADLCKCAYRWKLSSSACELPSVAQNLQQQAVPTLSSKPLVDVEAGKDLKDDSFQDISQLFVHKNMLTVEQTWLLFQNPTLRGMCIDPPYSYFKLIHPSFA